MRSGWRASQLANRERQLLSMLGVARARSTMRATVRQRALARNRRNYQRLRHESVARSEITTTFWRRRLEVAPPEEISVALILDGYIEGPLTGFLIRHLRPGQFFIDVGAHLGYFSALGAELVGQSGRVLAFEPTPYSYGILERNSSADAGTTQPHNLAVAAFDGVLQMTDLGPCYSAYNSSYQARLPSPVRDRVPGHTFLSSCVSLDSFLADNHTKVDLVKIDAESSELDILRGMDATLNRWRPTISLEIGDLDVPGAPQSNELIAHMESQNYVPCELDPTGRVVPLRRAERYGYANLVFLPAEDHRDA